MVLRAVEASKMAVHAQQLANANPGCITSSDKLVADFQHRLRQQGAGAGRLACALTLTRTLTHAELPLPCRPWQQDAGGGRQD